VLCLPLRDMHRAVGARKTQERCRRDLSATAAVNINSSSQSAVPPPPDLGGGAVAVTATD